MASFEGVNEFPADWQHNRILLNQNMRIIKTHQFFYQTVVGAFERTLGHASRRLADGDKIKISFLRLQRLAERPVTSRRKDSDQIRRGT
jgi:hypothetical protein